MITILELLEAHTVKRPWSEASRMRCKCGEVVTAETEGQLYALHRAHAAEVLEAHQQEREAEAWGKGVTTALNHAILNADGITLRLEHLDGRPWENPYRAEQVRATP